MANIIKKLIQHNAHRDPERLAMKYSAMRASAFTFLRASCHLFYERLPDATVLRKAPPVWACGDLHLENFGSYKGDNRLVYFDINDFDEALLAPATWDLTRFLASLIVGRGAMQTSRTQALHLCRVYLDAYATALALGKARWIERETAPAPVAELLGSVRDRPRAAFLDKRTHLKGKGRRITLDGRKALPASTAQKEQVRAFFEEFASRQSRPEFYRVLDVARRIAGSGSLGVDRYIVLVEGKGSPGGNYLLDLKQALPSSLRAVVPLAQPAWADEAHRIVAIQQRMQAISMAFLHAERMGGHSWVLRGLQPSEDRVALASGARPMDRMELLVHAMGECTAWAQLRSAGRSGSAVADELMDFGSRKKWRTALIEVAVECAERTESDWLRYCTAWDDGAFALAPSAKPGRPLQ